MLEKYMITVDYTVKAAIEKMKNENIKAVVVVDEEKKVLGLFSNGDMREFFLQGGALSDNISTAMNKTPKLYTSKEEAREERESFLRVIYPIVDNSNHLTDVLDFEQRNTNEQVSDALKDVPLVIMAGGKGTRLYPYTKILPKPLIPIGDVTITERIIDSFAKYGVKDVTMILNHKSGMIKSYMTELDLEYNLDFVKENDFLGTAGGLQLVKDRIKNTFILSNCDILIDDDIECVYKTHKAKKNKITMICSMKDVVIPYGVVETNSDGSIKNMQEKPDFSFLINTGVYMIEPEVLEDIKPGEFIHMPDLAQKYIDRGENVGVFPIPEKAWLDMGQFSEMENMMKSLGV